ncbi:MAG: hypothetical protein RSF40_01615 [Oscillospiraceae bacterium]
MRFTTKIDLEILRQIAEDYLVAENENEQFLRTWRGGWWDNIAASERIDYTKHFERSSAKSDALYSVCKMLGIEARALLVVIKSIRRWEQNHGKYDRSAYLQYLNDFSMEHLFQCISENYQGELGVGHYASTGRKIKA